MNLTWLLQTKIEIKTNGKNIKNNIEIEIKSGLVLFVKWFGKWFDQIVFFDEYT